MNKKANSAVMAAYVSRIPRQGELARIRAAEQDQAQRNAHSAAMHVIDVIESLAGPVPDIRGPLTGPRTATHPMATRIEPDTRGPQAPAALDHPVILYASRSASSHVSWMLAGVALIAGIAIGRAW